MNQVNIERVRFVGKSFSFVSGYICGAFPDKSEVKNGFPSIFSITEERYKWKDLFYKIGFKSYNPVVHSNDYYTSDLRSILKSINKEKSVIHYGFYEIKDIADKSLTSLEGKPLLINIARNEDDSFVETVIKVESHKNQVRIINMTTPKENIELMSIKDFEMFINNEEVNVRGLSLLTGLDGTAEGWLIQQEDLAFDKQEEMV